MNKSLQSTICLFLAAIIWGSAFVAQRSGMDDIGPFYFCALRSLIGSLALMIVFLLTDRRATLHKTADPNDPDAKESSGGRTSSGTENAAARWSDLRQYYFYRDEYPADGTCIYRCRQDWIYYGTLHRSGADFRNISQAQDRLHHLGGSCPGCCWIIFFMCERRLLHTAF